MPTRDPSTSAVAVVGALLVAAGCGRVATAPSENDDATEDTYTGSNTPTGESDGESDTNTPPDFGHHTQPPPPPGCPAGDPTCSLVDLLFVVDNSGTMVEEQIKLSASFPALIEEFEKLTDNEGKPLNPSVNVMFTTTDLGHPLCTPLQPEGYEPAQGEPQSAACLDRIGDFTGVGPNPPSYPEACTAGCPVPVTPQDRFIHFEGPLAATTNVAGNNVLGALSCIGPQGINGCGYEAPLEAMLQAIYPGALWNQGPDPFMRDAAMLAIVIITDEADCSVRAPDGYAFFTDPMQDTYWEIDPDMGTKTEATSAVCWNAGVDCGAPDANGVYADCDPIDTGALQPLLRYVNYLRDELISNQAKEIIMLAIVGVPPVTAHSPTPPYEPTAGGVEDLVYRRWVDGAYPAGDILPGDGGSAASKEFEFGIGPGCVGEDGMGGFTGQAIPPARVKEVCESLDEEDQLRCCIESVCDPDYSAAIGCLMGMVQTIVDPPA